MTIPVVYWRPGCGFCTALLNEIDQDGLDVQKINIWEDEDGAAFVREHNNGNEIVPTVAVGEQVLTNPFLAQIKELL